MKGPDPSDYGNPFVRAMLYDGNDEPDPSHKAGPGAPGFIALAIVLAALVVLRALFAGIP